jgi:hypothetical protein
VLARFIPIRKRRRGVELRVVIAGDPAPARVDLALIKAVARAHQWADDLLSGRGRSISEIATREKVGGRYARRLIRLDSMVPRIVEAIVEGRQPPELTAKALTLRPELHLLWSLQHRPLGVPRWCRKRLHARNTGAKTSVCDRLQPTPEWNHLGSPTETSKEFPRLGLSWHRSLVPLACAKLTTAPISIQSRRY